MRAFLQSQRIMFSESLYLLAGVRRDLQVAAGLDGMLFINLTAFCLLSTSKTDFLRCAESLRQAMVAAILCVEPTRATFCRSHSYKHTFWRYRILSSYISFMLPVSKHYCNARFCTFEYHYTFFSLRRRKWLLSIDIAQY